MKGIWFQSSTCGYPVFPELFVEEAVLSSTYIFDVFVKNQTVGALFSFIGLLAPSGTRSMHHHTH
jgi:hypothetical protein